MTDANPEQHQAAEKSQLPSMSVPRRVFVKGIQGVDVTVVVTVVRDTVWLSISPPFTWEAIMEPGKVDELMHVLELAREEAKEMATTRGAPPAGKAIVRAIARNTTRSL
jgi:hypothetical protein